jgi:hypothetical protein
MWCFGAVMEGRGQTASAGYRETAWEPIRLAAFALGSQTCAPATKTISHIGVLWLERRAVELYRREDALYGRS